MCYPFIFTRRSQPSKTIKTRFYLNLPDSYSFQFTLKEELEFGIQNDLLWKTPGASLIFLKCICE